MYLSDPEMKAIRGVLISQRDEIQGNMKLRATEGYEPETRGDEADIANSEGIAATLERLQGRDVRLLKKIDGALRWMDDEEFGYCESCGEEIGFKRLKARPAARLCIHCKQNQEQRERGFYHPRRRKARKG